MGTWSGSRALVTGASRGIGRAIAVALAAEGAHVVLVGRDWAALEQTAARCRETAPEEAARRVGGGAVATVSGPLVVVADITDPERGRRAARGEHGDELDLLANVAGAPGSASLLKDLDDVADWQAAFKLHVLAPARLLRVCYDALASAGGAVVNIGSIAANAAVPRSAAYSAAKAGLRVAHTGDRDRVGARRHPGKPGRARLRRHGVQRAADRGRLRAGAAGQGADPPRGDAGVRRPGRSLRGQQPGHDRGGTAHRRRPDGKAVSKVIAPDEAVVLVPDGSVDRHRRRADDAQAGRAARRDRPRPPRSDAVDDARVARSRRRISSTRSSAARRRCSSSRRPRSTAPGASTRAGSRPGACPVRSRFPTSRCLSDASWPIAPTIRRAS